MEITGAESINQVDEMTGLEFERFAAALYRKVGYSAYPTKASGDFGADIVMEKDGRKIVVQAKNWKKSCGFDAVKEIYTAKGIYGADEAWVLTTSAMTKQAKEAARKLDVRIVDRRQLCAEIEEVRASLDQKDKTDLTRSSKAELEFKYDLGVKPSEIVCIEIEREKTPSPTGYPMRRLVAVDGNYKVLYDRRFVDFDISKPDNYTWGKGSIEAKRAISNAMLVVFFGEYATRVLLRMAGFDFDVILDKGCYIAWDMKAASNDFPKAYPTSEFKKGTLEACGAGFGYYFDKDDALERCKALVYLTYRFFAQEGESLIDEVRKVEDARWKRESNLYVKDRIAQAKSDACRAERESWDPITSHAIKSTEEKGDADEFKENRGDGLISFLAFILVAAPVIAIIVVASLFLGEIGFFDLLDSLFRILF